MWFNAEEVADESFDLIPRGVYRAMITGAAERDSQAGHRRFVVEFTIIDGAAKGRKLFNGFNMSHPKEQVRNIALAEFKRLCTAIGLKNPKFSSPDDFLPLAQHKTLTISVEINGKYNNIDKFVGDGPAGSPEPASAPTNDDLVEIPF